jgi:methyl-accepting chemotaxis protein
MRSADAAKNTAHLIEKSQENADNGVAVTEEVSKQLVAIQESAAKIKTLIAEITAASKEQAQGIEQVNIGVAEMDKVVQQNAADAEESASAAEELSSQAAEMERMIGDLEALVGSTGSGSKSVSSYGGESHPAGGFQVRTASRGGMKRPRPDGKPLMIGSGDRKKGAERTKKDYDKVIPLNDDEFKDF